MENIGWGLWMTLLGMGSVFLLLFVLMLVLLAVGALDRPDGSKRSFRRGASPAPAPVEAEAAPVVASPEPADDVPAAPAVRILHDGLTADQIAAIGIAVVMHAQVRRAQAAPETRTYAPGSLLHASRWIAVGRSAQTQSWRRR